MAKFVLSERAKRDLVDIWRYTLENWSEEQAIRYYNKLMEGCEHIAGTLVRLAVTMKKSALAYEECSAGSILFSIGSSPKKRFA